MDITNIQSQSVFNNYIWIANPFLNCGGLQIRHINNENISTDGFLIIQHSTYRTSDSINEGAINAGRTAVKVQVVCNIGFL